MAALENYSHLVMDTINYQSPNTFLFLHHQISVNDANSMIYDWLKKHPQESRATLSKLLESKKVIVKHNKLYDLPRLSLLEAEKLVRDIKENKGVEVKDRKYKLTNYLQCFVGSELVSWLREKKEMTEVEAIAAGQNLLEHNLIAHVRNEHDFKNEFLFYLFTNLNMGHETPSPLNLPRLSRTEAIQLAKDLQENQELETKDRRHKLTSYKQCFVGSELVDCLVNNKNMTQDEAIATGQNLLEYGLISHVHNEHNFKNEFLFYQFQTS